jgi:hypothetical protein
MRRMFSRVLAVLAITAVAALGADNSIGTWKVNVAKSKYTPAPFPVKSLTSVREAAPDGVKVTNTGERTDGSSQLQLHRKIRWLVGYGHGHGVAV